MKAIIDSEGRCTVVYSTDGYDLTGCTVVNAPAPIERYVWDGTQFAPRPPTPAEETDAALEADARWQALKNASPAQIDAWLASNVTTISQARQVLKILTLAVQRLARTR